MNYSNLTASELQHYASLGMVPGHVVADRLPDIQRAIVSETAKELERPAYDRGEADGADAERTRAVGIIKDLLRALENSTFQTEHWSLDDAIEDARAYVNSEN